MIYQQKIRYYVLSALIFIIASVYLTQIKAHDQLVKVKQDIAFPLPSCYINNDNFLCCSNELENLMNKTYFSLVASRNGKWKKNNFHQISVALQRAAEKHFQTSFEIVVSPGDFASKNYFGGNLICKIKRDFSTIFAFATPNF